MVTQISVQTKTNEICNKNKIINACVATHATLLLCIRNATPSKDTQLFHKSYYFNIENSKPLKRVNTNLATYLPRYIVLKYFKYQFLQNLFIDVFTPIHLVITNWNSQIKILFLANISKNFTSPSLVQFTPNHHQYFQINFPSTLVTL